jgi:hypothetical protein
LLTTKIPETGAEFIRAKSRVNECCAENVRPRPFTIFMNLQIPGKLGGNKSNRLSWQHDFFGNKTVLDESIVIRVFARRFQQTFVMKTGNIVEAKRGRPAEFDDKLPHSGHIADSLKQIGLDRGHFDRWNRVRHAAFLIQSPWTAKRLFFNYHIIISRCVDF